MGAEPTGIPTNLIAEWIQFAATFVVAVIAGLSVRFGWASAKDVKPIPHDKHTDYVLPHDSKIVFALIESMTHAVNRITEAHEDSARHEKRQSEVMVELASDLRKLTRIAQELAEKLKS